MWCFIYIFLSTKVFDCLSRKFVETRFSDYISYRNRIIAPVHKYMIERKWRFNTITKMFLYIFFYLLVLLVETSFARWKSNIIAIKNDGNLPKLRNTRYLNFRFCASHRTGEDLFKQKTREIARETDLLVRSCRARHTDSKSSPWRVTGSTSKRSRPKRDYV